MSQAAIKRTAPFDTASRMEIDLKNEPSTQQELLADMHATFPGLFAKPGIEFGKGYADAIWTGGEALMPDGHPIFWDLGDDGYDGGVHQGFTAWLETRGWYLERYDESAFLAYPIAIVAPYIEYERLKNKWITDNPGATPDEYTAAMKDIAKNCGV